MNEIRIGPEDWDQVIPRVEGPQLVVAGPGTGKTEFLVRRASHLIGEGLVEPDQLVVLTFSRRGAGALRRRILDAVGRSVTAISASTFHSLARRLLEANSDRPLPELLTGPEQVSLVAELLAQERPGDWPDSLRGLLSSPTLASDTADFLLRCAERSVDPEALERLAESHPTWRALPALMRRYRHEMERRHRTDYGMLLVDAVALLGDQTVAARVADQFRYVLVDEFQDTSPAQADLLDLLTASHRRITVAGDPYQSVYSFRGAELPNVERFPQRFAALDGTPAMRIVLDTSFRVPRQILDAALRITSDAELPGAAGAVKPAPHRGVVEAYVFDQASAEAEWIAGQVERLHLVERMPFRQMAVAMRSKRHLLPELSRALERRRIPHDAPDSRLVDHPACQMVFDLARAAAWDEGGPPEETDQAVRRLLLGPLFGLSVAAERQLLRARRRTDGRWSQVLAGEFDDADALSRLLADSRWATEVPAADGFWTAWQELPQFGRLVDDPAMVEHRAAWSSFSQALTAQRERDPDVSLFDYWKMSSSERFEASPLLGVRGEVGDRLVLTTLHQTKGLEFEVVFLADATDDLFPDLRRGISLLQPHLLSPTMGADPADLTRFRLQEETRLAYTAMTRARRRVVWTATSAGIDEGERHPSRFLVAAAGVADRASLGAPPADQGPPITPRQVEALLRRTLADPEADTVERLAAVRMLAEAPEAHWDPTRFAGLAETGPDTGVLPERLTLSPSQVERYLECPRRYVFERRLAVDQPDSPYLRFGSLVHETLERLERRAIETGESPATLADALDELDDVWEQADFGSPQFDRAWRQKAVELLERLIGEWPSDAHHPVAVEHPLEMELGGVPWKGRADRIDAPAPGALRVVDYKTGKTPMPVAEAAVSVQLAYYLLASAADPRLTSMGTPTAAELWYPRTGNKEFRRSFDIDRLDEVRATIEEAVQRLRTEDWTPVVGPHCDRCHVRLVCPLWPEGRPGFVS